MTRLPHPRTVKTDIQYGITITYRSPLETFLDLKQQYCFTRSIIHKYLKPSCNTYVLYPELTVNSRIHWHGVINISNEENWHKHSLKELRRFGFVKIETNPRAKWFEYIKKSVSTMQKILELNRIELDHNYNETRATVDILSDYGLGFEFCTVRRHKPKKGYNPSPTQPGTLQEQLQTPMSFRDAVNSLPEEQQAYYDDDDESDIETPVWKD